eukprot:CAMPEP_0185404150 /NCGR_PEP_ID=MMETSP1364-20130426/92652_1 /TAXON_ID=38817 /ORGANISM="Gephyrocapsa oceanica, Strain RCC1303" /LENGTH=264 /DNA_ID=CAMNT_0028006449 /DNA_START=328 /DNA_END=1122 /DNA_ORIENTATION=+
MIIILLSGKVSLDQHALHRAVARGHAVCPLPDDTRSYFERERTFVRQRHAPATGVPAARYDLPYWCSGTFVLDAGQSRRLLGTWREEILSGKVSLDQHALHRAVARGHAVCPLPDDTRYVKDLEGTLRGLLHTRTLLHFQTAKASLPDYCAARRGGCSAPATATAQQIVRIDVSAPPPGAARSGRGKRNATYETFRDGMGWLWALGCAAAPQGRRDARAWAAGAEVHMGREWAVFWGRAAVGLAGASGAELSGGGGAGLLRERR